MSSIMRRLEEAFEKGGPKELQKVMDNLTEEEQEKVFEEFLTDLIMASMEEHRFIFVEDSPDLIVGFSLN